MKVLSSRANTIISLIGIPVFFSLSMAPIGYVFINIRQGFLYDSVDVFLSFSLVVFSLLFLGILVLDILLLFCYGRMVKFDENGVRSSFVGKFKRYFSWDEIEEIGIGLLDSRRPKRFLYFSLQNLSNNERSHMENTFIKKQKNIIMVSYDQKYLNYVNEVFPDRKRLQDIFMNEF